MPTYELLNTKNPEYDVRELRHLKALYEGNTAFEGCVREFLPKRPQEPQERYNLRVKESGYRNYIGPIVDFFTSMLFATRPTIEAKDKEGEPPKDLDSYYSDLRDDCDGQGANIDALFKNALTKACVYGRSWVRICAPSDEGHAPANLAEFRERGLSDCTIKELDTEEIIDWQKSASGELEFVVQHEKRLLRATIASPRNQVEETWTVYYPDRVDTYEIEYEKGERPHSDQEIKLTSSVPHNFGRVPLICLKFGAGLHIAGRLKSPQLAHFRKSCALNWSFSSTCYAQAVFKLKDRKSMPTMGAGYGIIIGADEEVDYISPPSDHFTALQEEVKAEKDEIFRVAHQMALGVENNSAAVGRSGESKQQDADNTRVVLLAFSRVVKEAIEKCFDLISEFRNDELKWSIGGLDDFAAVDVEGLLEALKRVDGIGGIPSELFMAEMLKRLSDALLTDTDQETRKQIHDQIVDGVKKTLEQEEELNEIARSAGFGAPGGPGQNGPGRGVPPGAPPGALKKGPGKGGGQRSGKGPQPPKRAASNPH